MKKLGIFLLVMLMISMFPNLVHSEGEMKGYMVSEYYYVSSHHDDSIEGQHGFWFRRIYFTYNNTLSGNLKMRLRLEMNSPGNFSESQTLTSYVKDAYLSYSLDSHEFTVGIQSPPTFNNIEKIWGYRALEKTPVDLQKFASSRDFGLALKGYFDSDKKVSYMVMFGNGSSNKAEVNRGKILYGQLGFKPVKGLYLETYADYETGNDDKRYNMFQGFVAYQCDWGRIGAQYSRLNTKEDDKKDSFDLFSIFAVAKASEKLDIIARYDKMFSTNPSAKKISYIPFSSDAPSNLFIGAISYRAFKNVWFIPNVKYVFYNEPDEVDKPSEDIYANLTLWFKF